jgi:gliding motility-associated-like protein
LVIDQLPTVQTSAVASSPVGTYPLTPTGGSDNNYSFSYVPGTLTITKQQQTITITDLPRKIQIGSTHQVSAESTSGLTVSFESLDSGIASVTGNNLTGVAKGSARIRAFSQGDQNYDPAEEVVTIEVFSSHKDIMNLFTPDGDGFNDYWELPKMNEWGKCDVRVYNRWGKLVFANPDYNNLWDGTSNGAPVPEGAYYYIINTQNAGVVKGTVNIVR